MTNWAGAERGNVTDLACTRRFQRRRRYFHERSSGPEPSSDPAGRDLTTKLVDGALPHNGYSPTQLTQSFKISPVALQRLPKLRVPEFHVRGRCGGKGTSIMPVPEAALDLDDSMMFGKHYVGPSRQTPSMEPISQAKGMQSTSKHQFGLCVLASDPCHHAGAGFPVDYICHPVFPNLSWCSVPD